MAVISQISSGAVAPPDFNSPSGWEAWAQNEFGTTPDEYIAECYDDFGGPLVDPTTVSDWGTTSQTNRPVIRAAAGQGHGGVVGAGFILQSDSGSVPAYVSDQSYASIEGIQLNGATSGSGAILDITGGTNANIDSVIVFSRFGGIDGLDINALNATVNNVLVDGPKRYGMLARTDMSVNNLTVVGSSGTSGFRATNPCTISNSVVASPSGANFHDQTATAINCASRDSSAYGTSPVTGVSDLDFVNYANADYNPAIDGLLDGAGTSPPVLSLDIAGKTRRDPDDIGAYAIAAPAGVTFDGPTVQDMTGTELVDFGSQPGDMASRFTNGNSYFLSPDSSALTLGLYVDPVDGNIKGTTANATAIGSPYDNIIVRASIEVHHRLDVGAGAGNDFGFENLSFGDLTPRFVTGESGPVEVVTLIANSVSGAIIVQTLGNDPLWGATPILLHVEGAEANPYELPPQGGLPIGLYDGIHPSLAGHIAGNVGGSLNLVITEGTAVAVYGQWDAASISFAESVGGGLTVDAYQIATVTDGTSTVKSDISQTTGTHYFEIVGKGAFANAMVGLSDGSNNSGFPGSYTGSISYWSKNGQIRESGANIGGQPTIPQTTTSVYSVIVDIDAETISWYVDGVAGTQDWSLNLIAAEAGGIANLRPAVGNGGSTDSYEYRINAGQEAFAHPETIPDGCHLGWGLNLPVKEPATTNPVQQQTLWQDFAIGASSGSLTYPVTPTAGNLLISALTVDKDSGPITVPTGWTIIGTDEFGNTVSGAFAYKVSDGTEGAVAWTWTNSEASHVIWISEYSGISELDVFAEANSADADVTSQTTGTTAANTVANSLAVAIWGADTSSNVDNDPAYSSGFVELHPFDPGALVGMAIATKILTGTAAVESTYTTTGGGDAMYGKVAVFK